MQSSYSIPIYNEFETMENQATTDMTGTTTVSGAITFRSQYRATRAIVAREQSYMVRVWILCRSAVGASTINDCPGL